MEAIPFDHPLRTDTDVVTEDTLQRAFVEIQPTHNVIHPRDRSISDDPVNDLVNHRDIRVPLRQPRTKEIVRECDHLSFVFA